MNILSFLRRRLPFRWKINSLYTMETDFSMQLSQELVIIKYRVV